MIKEMKATATASEYLQGLKPGAPLTIQVDGVTQSSKFRSYAPGADKFSATTSGRIGWYKLSNLLLESEAPAPVMQVVKDEPVVAVEKPQIAEFSQRILVALGEHGEPMLANALADALGENIRRVAGSLTGLSKAGLIESHGGENKKGGKHIGLTDAGRVLAGVAAPEPAQVAEVPEEEFVATEEHVLAMEAVGAGMEVTNIFTANKINDLHEAYSNVVEKGPARTDAGYFFATITEAGMEYCALCRENLGMGEYVAPEVVVAQAEPAAPATEKKTTKAARKPRATAEANGEAVIAMATGRAGAARTSLREQVLALFKKLANGKSSYREVLQALVESTKFTKAQLQNAAFKLTKAGFLVADGEGRTASPLRLTEAGEKGYATNHGQQPIRPVIESFIEDGMNNHDIALRVGCDISYVSDVRTNRRIGYKAKRAEREKMVEEAVTE